MRGPRCANPVIAASVSSRGFGSCAVVCNFDITKEQYFEVDLLRFLKFPRSVHCVDLLTNRVYEFPGPRIELELPQV